MGLSNAEKLEMCRGCRNNFYNGRQNFGGGNTCWHLKTAKLVTRMRVGIWQNPPYEWNPQRTLSCHSPENSTTWIDKDDCRVVMPEKKS